MTQMSSIPSAPIKSQRLFGIQCLRGIAALLVVWFHLKFNLGVLMETALAHLPAWSLPYFGAIGVDIFFVISGLVISISAGNFGKQARFFFLHRFARIAPLYYLVSLYSLIYIIGANTIQHCPLPEHILNSIFNSLFFLPVFDQNQFVPPLATIGWTLCFEMWFYLLISVMMMFLGGRLAVKIMPFFLLAGVIGNLVFFQKTQWFLPRFLFHPMTLEFAAGCLIYQARHLLNMVCFVLLCLFLIPLFFWVCQTPGLGEAWAVIDQPGLGLERAVVWGGFSATLVAIVAYADWHWKLNWPKFLLLLGNASFSIYLIHPCSKIFASAYGLFFHQKPGMLICGLIYLSTAIFVSLLIWKYIEMPLTKRVKTWLLSRHASLGEC